MRGVRDVLPASHMHQLKKTKDKLAAPADGYFDRAETILAERERIKRTTIANRRLQHQLQTASILTRDEPEPPFSKRLISLKSSADGHRR